MDFQHPPVSPVRPASVMGSESTMQPPAQDAHISSSSTAPPPPTFAPPPPLLPADFHPEPLSVSQMVGSPAPPVVHAPSPPAHQQEEQVVHQQSPMNTSDSSSASTSLQPASNYVQQPPQPSFTPSPIPQPPALPPVQAPAAQEEASFLPPPPFPATSFEAPPPPPSASFEALPPASPAQQSFQPSTSVVEQAPSPVGVQFPPLPVQSEREITSPLTQPAPDSSSFQAPQINGYAHHQQHSIPTPPPTIHEQDHQAHYAPPVVHAPQVIAQAPSPAPALNQQQHQQHQPQPSQSEAQASPQQYQQHHAPPHDQGYPLPPPPAELPPSHPLAPPPAPFPAAFPTPAETTFDPVAPAPAQYLPHAGSSGSLKREYSEEVGDQHQQHLQLQQQQYGETYQAPQAKRAKIEGPPSGPLTAQQQKFFLSTVRSLKKMREAFAFSAPVDPIALGIPHYFQIVQHPMDLSTVEYKLAASGPKPKGRADKGKYANKDEVATDFERVWDNSVKFNGPDHLVSLAGLKLGEAFEKAMRGCPPDEVYRPPPPPPAQYQGYPPDPYGQAQAPVHPPAQPIARRASVSNGAPAPRRNSEVDGRPKREIHAPAHKDLGWTEGGSHGGSGGGSTRRKSGGGKKGKGDEQMKYLKKELTDLVTKKQYYELAFPFMYPVDPVALNIPDYPKIVKRPMDLSTIRQNLQDNYYDDPQEVNSDVKLMFKNCYLFNPPGTPVAAAGKALQNVWEEKWRAMPVKEEPAYESESEEEQGNSDDDTMDLIGQQMAALSRKLDELRKKKNGSKSHKSSSSSHKKSSSSTQNGEPRPKGSNTHPKTAQRPKPPPSVPSASSSSYNYTPAPSAPKPKKTSTGGSNGGGPKKPKRPKKADEDFSDDEGRPQTVTMAQKQELADKIQVADGEILNQAIMIIQASMPLGDAQEEIELDIESLPSETVLKLYNLVVRGPKKPRGSRKGGSGGNKGGTGGLNRKSMDEEHEAERIRKLEAGLAAFGQPAQPQSQQYQPQQQAQQQQQQAVAKSDSEGSESGSDSASDSD